MRAVWPRKRSSRAVFPWPLGGRAHGASSRTQSFLSPISFWSQFHDLMPWADEICSLRSMATWQAFNHPLNGDLWSSSSFAHHRPRNMQERYY